MYMPSQFSEQRVEILHQFVRDHPLGALVTSGSDGLCADHIPFEIVHGSEPFGSLRAHAARSNPFWKDHASDSESLVIFQGTQSYVSPSWYVSKAEDGRVVPTYNYMVVHAYGRLRVIEDKQALSAMLEGLVAKFEATQPCPWKIDDAPADYIDKLLQTIVGIEIPITRLVGKWKVSQNQPPKNRISVEQMLREKGDENALAMADAVSRRGA
jgi:transcriptional regulator